MFQTFEDKSDISLGPERLSRLRKAIEEQGLAGFIVPRADTHQGEYVAPCDERLAWLTGFSGSAGFAAILMDEAGVFVDGRYTLQVRDQVDTSVFTPVAWPATQLGPWLNERVSGGDVVGFDPWLHTSADIENIKKALKDAEVRAVHNLVDHIWEDRPARPNAPVTAYPLELSGQSSADKRANVATTLRDAGVTSAVLTMPDSIAWLLNIRGSDIARIPVVQSFAIIHDDGRVDLFSDPEKFDGVSVDAKIMAWDQFPDALANLAGPVGVDPKGAPYAVWKLLEQAKVTTQALTDPCALPKACKNPIEIEGTKAAHQRDGVAMVEFLSWLSATAPDGGLSEIDVVEKLEGFRRATNVLRDISFETISGAGPNGAIVHYRVTRDTNRAISAGDILLVDSGGQYLDGTTDITRTVAIGGAPSAEQKRAFTLVLKGMIAISRARFPEGIAGRDLDVLARNALWQHGLDYNHGTGHGVGAFLSVHEGPQGISRINVTPLKTGMILSNEPGYYKSGEYGIRIENLCVVREADALPDADDRAMLAFETLTWVPIDTSLVDADLLGVDDRAWLNAYHAEVADRLKDLVSDIAKDWLIRATAPI